jgi:hypothetical protein
MSYRKTVIDCTVQKKLKDMALHKRTSWYFGWQISREVK